MLFCLDFTPWYCNTSVWESIVVSSESFYFFVSRSGSKRFVLKLILLHQGTKRKSINLTIKVTLMLIQRSLLFSRSHQWVSLSHFQTFSKYIFFQNLIYFYHLNSLLWKGKKKRYQSFKIMSVIDFWKTLSKPGNWLTQVPTIRTWFILFNQPPTTERSFWLWSFSSECN